MDYGIIPVVRLYGKDNVVPVASRKFGVVRGSRCYCMWYKRCKCYDGQTTRAVQYAPRIGAMLSQAEYNEAGQPGDVPPGTVATVAAFREGNTLAASQRTLAMLIVAMLALGLVKAVSPYRSHWQWMVSSDWLADFHAYKEPEIRHRELVRDSLGFYVHPDTWSRNIQLLDRGHEFVTNLLFFVNLPATYCRYRFRGSDYTTGEKPLHPHHQTASAALSIVRHNSSRKSVRYQTACNRYSHLPND